MREKWVTSLVLALEQWFALWNIDSSQRQKLWKHHPDQLIEMWNGFLTQTNQMVGMCGADKELFLFTHVPFPFLCRPPHCESVSAPFAVCLNFISFAVLPQWGRWMAYADDKHVLLPQHQLRCAFHFAVAEQASCLTQVSYSRVTYLEEALVWMPQCGDTLGQVVLLSYRSNVFFS